MNNKTRKIALSGVLSAFIIISLILESIMPTGRLGFYVLAAFILSIVLMEAGIGWGWACYAVTCAGGFLLVPEKLNLLPYIMFFGIYTLLKFHIETIRKPWIELILKLSAFNLFLWPAWNIAKTFLPPKLTQGTGVLIGGIILQIAFIFYDYLFTCWIRYYIEKISPRIRKA
ncbi:MAG: hypothetical protein GX957_13045 [Clostridiaceae bacterium]|nr:hypothetical protein [Clostridiaceae bacterium]